MKKILLVFLLLFSIKVKAITFYSDYSLFSDYSTNYIENDDITIVEEIENKKYYINKKIYSDDGVYTDYDNYTEEKSGLLDEKPISKENRIINTYDNSYYLNIPKVRYIYLDNSSGIRVREIALYINDNRYYYEFRCNECFFGSYIKIDEDDYFKIDLKDYYDVDDIKIMFILENTNMHFKIDISYLNDITFYKDKIDMDVIDTDSTLIFDFYSGNLIKDVLEKDTKNDTNQLYIKNIKYEYIDKIYKKYNIEKEYTNIETSLYDIEKLYRYKKRDRIIIDDEIIITSKDYDLNNYISSTCEYEIKNNIDILNNGTYDIIIKFKDQEIKRKAVVNISSNNKEDVSSLKNIIQNKEYEIKKVIEEKEKVNEEVNTLNYMINNSPKENLEDVKVSNSVSKRILFIFLFIILLMIIILIIRKKSN